MIRLLDKFSLTSVTKSRNFIVEEPWMRQEIVINVKQDEVRVHMSYGMRSC